MALLRAGPKAGWLGGACDGDDADAENELCPNQVYKQCGGQGFSGRPCCPAGTVCSGDQWWKQCRPAGEAAGG